MKIAAVRLLDLGIRSRLLSAKIIAWDTENNESLVLVCLLELLELENLVFENRLARQIDDQQHLALERGEWHFLAIKRNQRVVVCGLICCRCAIESHGQQHTKGKGQTFWQTFARHPRRSVNSPC